MTYQDTNTKPTIEELALWTDQTRDWFTSNNRKRISKNLKADLAERGAKWCPTCRQVRLVEDFQKNTSRADGFNSNCRACQNGVQRGYMRNRYHNDPEFREQKQEYFRTMRSTNEMYRLRNQLDNGYRRAVKAGVHAEWITPEQILLYWEARGIDSLRCVYTGEDLTPQNRSLDHATPISRGGSHTVENLVPSSFDANHRKREQTATEFVIGRSEESDLDDFDSLPEDVKRALSPQAPARSRRIVDLNPEVIEG